MRIGHGFDAHRFTADRPLILGGVDVPYALGLEAHSDGDVLIHSVCDALLGALGLGDIGRHFPDTSQDYANIDSRVLLRAVTEKMNDAGYRIGNVDITVIAQEPKLAAYISSMQANVASDLDASIGDVNIKATTTERMGFTGRSEGIACHAVCVILPSS